MELASMLKKGDGVKKDINEAYSLYEYIACYTNKEAYYAAKMNQFEQGIKRDIRAIQYFSKKAICHLKQAFNKPDNKYKYARLLQNGIGVETNTEKAKEYYLDLIKHNYSKAIYRYITLLYNEKETNEDDNEEINKYIKLLIDKGEIKYIHKIARDLDEGHCVDVNRKESFRLYKIAAENGYARSYYQMHMLLFIGYKEFPEDINESIKYLKMGADLGDRICMMRYYDLYKKGNSRLPLGDFSDLVKYAKQLADTDYENYPDSTYRYAYLLINGDKIPKKINEGLKYLKKGIDKKGVNCTHIYAQMLGNGKEIPQNLEESFKLFKCLADEASDADSCFQTGCNYFSGEGTQKDLEKAAFYYRKAIDRGNIDSIYIYAAMLERGDGGQRNLEDAIKLYKKGALYGDLDCLRRLGKLLPMVF